MEEVQKAVKAMKSRKEPNADRITAEVLKASGEKLAEIFQNICNAASSMVRICYDHRRHNRSLRLTEVLPCRVDILYNIKTREDTFTFEYVTRHRRLMWFGAFAVCNEISSVGKHTNKISKDSGREDGH